MNGALSRIILIALWTAACGGSYAVAQNGVDGGGSPRTDAAGAPDVGSADATGASDAMDANAADGPPSLASDSAADVLSGTYTGYVEAFQFPDGSDTVVLKLAFASDGAVTGTVQFGSAALLAPPTDPSIGYPPNLTSTAPAGLLEGFAFTVLGGTYTAPRVHLTLYNNELWKQWCELQTVIYEVDNGDPTSDAGPCGAFFGYGCLPNGGTMTSASGCSVGTCTTPPSSLAVDCGKLVLCMGGGRICSCTATSCTVSLPATGPTSFDMQLRSGALNGTVTGLDTQLHNVHLTRGP
jgi:hypothetical protein